MCIVDYSRDIYIYDEWTARDFLSGAGLSDERDQNELMTMLQSAYVLDLEYKCECITEEFKSYEISLDAAQGLLNELLVLCDELEAKARTKEGLKLVSTIKRTIEQSEVF